MLKNNAISTISLSYPKYIIFNDYLKLSTEQFNDELIDSITFKSDEITNIITNEILEDISKKYKTTIKLDSYKDLFKEIDYLISMVINEFKINEIEIKKDILENTFYLSSDSWNITNLVRKYKLSSFDIFASLVSDSNFKIEDIKKDFDNNKSNNGYRYFDYYNGIGIKCRFPDNVINNPIELNMRRYNDRNYNSGYHKIIKLISDNYDKKSDDFIRYYPKNNDKTIIESVKDIVKDTILNTINKIYVSFFKPDVNKKINDYVEKETLYIYEDEKIKDKKLFLWNHRTEYCEEKCGWDFQMMQYYDKYIKNEIINISDTFDFDLDFDFTEDKNYKQLKYSNIIPMKDISMVNMLIFGKTIVTFGFLERLLSYIRYTEENYHFQLDNYVIVRFDSYGKQKYRILWKDDNINTLKFCQTDYEKLYAAKRIIELMNEVDPVILNYHNYIMIGKWIMINENSICQQYSQQYMETRKNESKNKLFGLFK
jgi:hypothetical protein